MLMFSVLRLVVSFGLLTCSLYPVRSQLMSPQDFLDHVNQLSQEYCQDFSYALWTFSTNITAYNQKRLEEATLAEAKASQEFARNASQYDLSQISDPQIKRQFMKIKDIGTAAQTNEKKLKRLTQLWNEMKSIYSTAKVCLSENECLSLEPDLVRLFRTSRDYNQLQAAWKGWRDVSGAKMKDIYPEFVSLSNEAIQLLGHADTGAYWRSRYDIPDFENEVHDLFIQLRPLYEQLHGFVRRRLRAIYGSDKFPSSGHIPAHLLGNMWSQSWYNLLKDVMPYPNKELMDMAAEMVKQGYTPLRIFQAADDFFKSLGMIEMPELFWEKSMLEKPTDGREVVCHASAFFFCTKDDYRVKMCTGVTQEDFETAHHEMGHIEYYLQYAHLPQVFQRGANKAFHEAIGDTISLAVQTPEHMHAIGLLPVVENDTETDINFLMSMALQKIAFLPFGYLIDQWRWSVFRGDTSPEQYNQHWWDLRCKYQGVSSPVQRSSSDFDPGAKYHIPSDTPYIRYFIANIIQFQFYKAMCDAAGHQGPLHRCDFYNSHEAGTLFSDMLKLGSSKPWTEAMFVMTKQTKMDAGPLMDYFAPLLNFLQRENGNDYGWSPDCPTFSADTSSRACGTHHLVIAMLLLVYTLVRMVEK